MFPSAYTNQHKNGTSSEEEVLQAKTRTKSKKWKISCIKSTSARCVDYNRRLQCRHRITYKITQRMRNPV